jgi:hypothetical protein
VPLTKGKSPKVFSGNVKAEMDAGKPQKQAVAIAYSEAGESRHSGKNAPNHRADHGMPAHEAKRHREMTKK